MGWRRETTVGLAFLVGLGCATGDAAGAGAKPVLGGVEAIRVREAGLDFLARIDTGADASAIHAVGIRLAPAPDGAPVAGREVAFTLVNERGEARRVRAVVADAAEVRTAAGTESRLRVDLHLGLGAHERRVRVSLRDRSRMQHKLLVGRDWLEDAFLVDVSKPTSADQ